MSDTIDYGNLMHDAMRELIRNVLLDVVDRGLPGEHHFFISFRTTHPDVEIADWLFDRYPHEMTVVMQHWYDNLVVDEDGFAVTLNFGEKAEPLYIPYHAITTFVDPSVEFGLRFDTGEDDHDALHAVHEDDIDEVDAPDDALEIIPDPDPDPVQPSQDAEIVQLDSFRK